MAMLAEPRRKVRYIVDPSGQDWAKNENQFGQRIMQSMGWRHGQGLGKDGQGAPEPIRVKRKSDQRGVGCSGAYAEASMPQSVDFASLLSQLNAAHGGDSGDGSAGGPETGGQDDAKSSRRTPMSLEAKSRSSRARLHYHRFTRGKDVSAYDQRALACIFGSRREKEVKKEEAEPEPDRPVSHAEAVEEAADDASGGGRVGFGFGAGGCETMKQSRSDNCLVQNAEQQHGLQLVQSQTSLRDYFKVKMQERQRQQQIKLEDVEQQQQVKLEDAELQQQAEADAWTSESSCSAPSTLSDGGDAPDASPTRPPQPASKKVRFSVEPPAPPPPPAAETPLSPEPPMVVIDFGLFPGCAFHCVLGYPHY